MAEIVIPRLGAGLHFKDDSEHGALLRRAGMPD
jgi:hypothetical protein